MSNLLGINPKHYKHVKSDDKSTTLRHKDGHTLNIAHNVLNPEMRAQLKALSNMTKEDRTPVQAQEAQLQQPDNKISKMTEGGEARKMYADPQEPVSNQDSAPVQADTPQEEQPAGMEFGRHLRKLISENPHIKAADAIMKTEGKALQAIPGFIKGLTADDEAQQPMFRSDQEEPQLDQSALQTELGQPTRQASPSGQPETDQSVSNYADLLSKGMRNQIAGEKAVVPAIEQKSQQEIEALGQNAAQQQDVQNAFHNEFGKLNQERQDIMNDMEQNHINPENFWTGDKDGNGSHSKIMTGLGIILAGFNPTNNPNQAVNFLKFQMEQNLKAQELELGKKNNLLSANLRQFGNLRDAADMTRLQQAMVLETQMKKAAATAATPMAQAQMLENVGKIQQTYAPLMMQMGMTKALMSLGSGGGSTTGSVGHTLQYLNALAPDKARDYQSKYYAPFDVPGGKSIADRPIPEDERNQLTAMTTLDDKGKDLLNFIHKHTGTWNPQTRSVAAQKVEEMKNFYNNSIQGGALTEGRLGWYDEQFKKHPTDILAQIMGSTAKLNEMVNSNSNRKNIILHSYGLYPPGYQQGQNQNQGQPQYKTVNGIRYMRGPNGEAIPVK